MISSLLCNVFCLKEKIKPNKGQAAESQKDQNGANEGEIRGRFAEDPQGNACRDDSKDGGYDPYDYSANRHWVASPLSPAKWSRF